MSFNWKSFVDSVLAEDVGPGDLTTTLTVAEDRRASGRFIAREPMVVAGTEALRQLYSELRLQVADGDRVEPGAELARVAGPARDLLTKERTALNLLQRLSGVATNARRYVDAVAGTKCRVLDTRKTTPGLRFVEKMAAAAGGVVNHRMGLYDAVLIKNNHITAAGGVRAALERTRGATVPVEIEVRTWDELNEALSCGATRLLLDNLTPQEARRWIEHIGSRASTEISGGVTLATIRAYAEAGADFVSVGAITHSAMAVDINFRLELA